MSRFLAAPCQRTQRLGMLENNQTHRISGCSFLGSMIALRKMRAVLLAAVAQAFSLGELLEEAGQNLHRPDIHGTYFESSKAYGSISIASRR